MKIPVTTWQLVLLTFVVLVGVNDAETVPGGECRRPPAWTAEGVNVMGESRGNVTLVALMELQCSFCRSQIDRIMSLWQMLKNQSFDTVRIVIVAPANESMEHVNYWRRYFHSSGVRIYKENTYGSVWSTLKGNKDDFFIYDTCGRLNYYIPYPQSYLYYHYTISSLYSVIRKQKCGPCNNNKLIGALKVRAYVNKLTDNSTTILHYVEKHGDQAQVPLFPPSSTASPGSEPGNSSRVLVTPVPTQTEQDSNEEQQTSKTKSSTDDMVVEVHPVTFTPPAAATPADALQPVTPEPETLSTPTDETDEESEEVTNNPEIDEGSKVNLVTGSTTEDEYEEYEDYPTDDHNQWTGGGAVGSVGPGAMSRRIKIRRKTTATSSTVASTSAPWSAVRDFGVTTKSHKPVGHSKTPSGDRVPKLSDAVNCDSFTDEMCFQQWQSMGTLHGCCKKGVYMTNICKSSMCTNKTYHLCCFQKYQQARYQCCNDDRLEGDSPHEFSRCCYGHFVYDDPDDKCCPKSVAAGFWWNQPTRVAELCLPNVELVLDDIVLEAETLDKNVERIALKDSTALSYNCSYVEKRTSFFFWEPEEEEKRILLQPPQPKQPEKQVEQQPS